MPAIKDSMYRGDPDYWKTYREGRPQIPDSFFNRVIEYHTKKGGQFDVFHDAGSGSGVHTARLAPNFKRTIISDPGEANIAAGKAYLGEKPEYEFHVAKFEDVQSQIEPGSVDLIFACNMLHFTNVDEALQSAARQLKPGGTFAVACVGYIVMLDPTLQKLWARLYKRMFGHLLADTESGFIDVARLVCNPYDSVPFNRYFQPGMERIRLNERDGWNVRRMAISPQWDDLVPNIWRGSEEDNVVREDSDDWIFDLDLPTMKSHLATMPLKEPDQVLEDEFAEFVSALDGKKAKGIWPAVLELATKD